MRMRIDQSGRFEVSGAGILLLGVATLLASGAVFLLGVYVGKAMVEQRMMQESRVVRLPVPTPGAAAKSDEVDVTFWDKLAKGEATPAAAPAATPTVAEAPVRVAPGASAVRPTEPPAPEPTAAPPKPPPAETTGKGSFQVQVNAMADKGRADQLLRDLKSLGYAAYVSSARVGDKTLYRVRVGGLGSEPAAKQAVTKLREQGYPNAFLVAE
jgi:cell division septation protein DedD